MIRSVICLLWFALLCFSTNRYVEGRDSKIAKYQYKSSDEHRSELNKAVKWLIDQRGSDHGWGKDTARAVTALFLAKSEHADEDLMLKQLDLQLAIDMTWNKTRIMHISDLALYINALRATCRNPKNFHGHDLVEILRVRVDFEHKMLSTHQGVNQAQVRSPVNPLVFLTLCMNNASNRYDVRQLQEFTGHRGDSFKHIDLLALSILASVCIERADTAYTGKLVHRQVARMLQMLKADGTPVNVYETALLIQAMNAANVNNTVWDRQGVTETLLNAQNSTTGGFKDVLSTYYALPALAGKTILSLEDICDANFSVSPLDQMKYLKKMIYVQYTLRYGFPIEMQQTMQLYIPGKTKFLDVMKMAAAQDANFRFELDNGHKALQVYSIGGIPNDAEKGLYWQLEARVTNRDDGRSTLYSNAIANIEDLVLDASDEATFWLKPL